jgi:hypothetical protein
LDSLDLTDPDRDVAGLFARCLELSDRTA